MSGLDDARAAFAKLGAPFPPVAQELAERLEARLPGSWSTRTDVTGVGFAHPRMEEAATHDVREWAAIGHAGHGANSWNVCWYQVRGPLALFVQGAFGGAYTDAEKASAWLTNAFAAGERLVAAADAAVAAGRLAAGARLVVFASDTEEPLWCLFPERVSKQAFFTAEWHAGGDALAEALMALEA